MPYTLKGTIASGTADTSYGAALNTTSVPGWQDTTGNYFKLSSNKIISAGTTANLLKFNYLLNGNTYLNAGEGDQYVEFRIKAGERDIGKRVKLRADPASIGGKYVQFDGVLDPTARFAQLSSSNGGAAINTNTPVFGLDNAKEYRVRFGVSGTLGGSNVAIYVTIYNITDSAAHLWNSGSDTFTWNPTTQVPDTGIIVVTASGGSGGGLVNMGLPVDVYTQGTPTDATATVSEYNANNTTAGLTLAIGGGVGPYTVDIKCNGTSISGYPQSVSAAGNVTVIKTGLTAATHNIWGWTVTPTTGGAAASNQDFITEPLDLSYLRDNLNMTAVGDSITDDTSRSITLGSVTGTGVTVAETAHSVIARSLGGVFGTALTTNFNRVAVSGYSSGAIAALASEVVDVVNGNYTGAHTTGSAHPSGKPAQIIPIRLGKNDTGTAAETVANIQTIIDAIRAGCSHNPWIIIGRITGTQGTGAAGPIADNRQYAANLLLDALHDPDNRIVVESMSTFWAGVYNPARIPDMVHPDADYRGLLVDSTATATLDAILGLTAPGGGSSSDSSRGTGRGSMSGHISSGYDDIGPAVTTIPDPRKYAWFKVSTAGTLVCTDVDGVTHTKTVVVGDELNFMIKSLNSGNTAALEGYRRGDNL